MRRRLTVHRFALIATLLLATAASAQDGFDCQRGSSALLGPQGPGCYVRVEHSDRHPALFWPGFSSFVAAYAFSVGFGVFYMDQVNDPDATNIFGVSLIPLAGPFAMAAMANHVEDQVFASVLGGVQIVGAVFMLLSHVFERRTESLVRIAFTGNGVAGTF
jgi:hypothetical protein